MSRTKIKERLVNAFDAFFDNEKLCENNALIIPHYYSASFSETESFADKHKTLIKILKRVFLFLPGAFGFFFMSVAFTGFFILRPPFGEGHHIHLGVFVTLISGLMTFLGLGDWQNPKHLFIPLSIFSLSAVLAIVGSITHGADNFPQFIDNYAAYFLPLAFIVPFLAKSLVDKTEVR